MTREVLGETGQQVAGAGGEGQERQDQPEGRGGDRGREPPLGNQPRRQPEDHDHAGEEADLAPARGPGGTNATRPLGGRGKAKALRRAGGIGRRGGAADRAGTAGRAPPPGAPGGAAPGAGPSMRRAISRRYGAAAYRASAPRSP